MYYDVLSRHGQHNQHEQINAFGVIEILWFACESKVTNKLYSPNMSVCCAHTKVSKCNKWWSCRLLYWALCLVFLTPNNMPFSVNYQYSGKEMLSLVSNFIGAPGARQATFFPVTKWLFGFVCLIGAKNLVVSSSQKRSPSEQATRSKLVKHATINHPDGWR